MFRTVMLVGLAGAAGTLARWGLSSLIAARAPSWPWATLTVNVLGCFAFGLVWAAWESHPAWGLEGRTALLAGFMGAFTTFSTFGYESVALARAGRPGAAVASVAAQLLLGLGAVVLGLAAGRKA